MKAILKSISGEKKGDMELPVQFNEEVRPDLIKRAVLSIQSNSRQPYGTTPEAGKKYSAKLSRRRRDYKTAYGIGISRVPRKILSYRGTRFNWQAAESPGTVGGRQAHPPTPEKIFAKALNKKERRKAIRSAMAAAAIKDNVLKRGHIVEDYPLVIDNSAETVKKTKEVSDMLVKLGFGKELERASKKTPKTGRAKTRGRTAKKRKGPLFVVSKRCELLKSAPNLPGVEVVMVKDLNAELLAPGCDYGRLTIYTEAAIDMLEKEKLFLEKKISPEKTTKAPKAKVPSVKKEKPVKAAKAPAGKKKVDEQ